MKNQFVEIWVSKGKREFVPLSKIWYELSTLFDSKKEISDIIRNRKKLSYYYREFIK